MESEGHEENYRAVIDGEQSGSEKAAGEDGQQERGSQMSKGKKEEQFHE
jgi:hypothetical protein